MVAVGGPRRAAARRILTLPPVSPDLRAIAAASGFGDQTRHEVTGCCDSMIQLGLPGDFPPDEIEIGGRGNFPIMEDRRRDGEGFKLVKLHL